MDEKIFNLRRYYFSFLYLSFIYVAVLIMVIGKGVKPVQITDIEGIILGSVGIVPAVIIILRKIRYIYEKSVYIKLLLLGQIPLVAGTFFSIFKSNYVYFFVEYPLFLLTYILLLPTRKAVKDERA
ncbi:hypothetical protein GWK41_02190 [Persephonella atlantica]|uniref:Uncharacterized protein n=1 Tax=Persephonella atlantica TaxID=2699429 RepID=A0ABS1GG26_9AQUI|nr:hypothetical protein [Persephonella atlantica]MBK3331876.1 hypothetical protein [Persephonella atlantica]